MLPATARAALEAAGFLVIDRVIPAADLDPLRNEADRLLLDSPARGGARNVLSKSQVLREVAESGTPAQIARSVLGEGVLPRKLTIFDKRQGANWLVPWHQDLTIAIAERREVDGFGPWSIKDGLPHVQPPVTVLEQILAIRVHLDETPAAGGALRVLPGTHRLGRLSTAQVDSLRRELPETVCPVPAGGAMLLRPLLLHASSASTSPTRRRVLHFEFSTASLPGGLAWA